MAGALTLAAATISSTICTILAPPATATDPAQATDYGKLKAKIVGQHSRFPWDKNNIPNLNIDVDQFVESQRIAS